MIKTSVGQAICDAVYEADTWSSYPSPKNLRSIEFRRGLGEIDVCYVRDDDDVSQSYAVIPAEGVLTAMLNQVLEREKEL